MLPKFLNFFRLRVLRGKCELDFSNPPAGGDCDLKTDTVFTVFNISSTSK